MKKYITTALLSTLIWISAFANNPNKYSYEDLYKDFANEKGVEAINIGSFLIGLTCLLADEIDYGLIKGIEKVTILDISGSTEIIKTKFKNSIDKINDAELLMEVSDSSGSLKIFIEKEKDDISRLIIVEAETPCIISIEGKMSRKDISKFAAELNN